MEGYREMGEIPLQKKNLEKHFPTSYFPIFTFESLASLSTVVAVALRGVART